MWSPVEFLLEVSLWYSLGFGTISAPDHGVGVQADMHEVSVQVHAQSSCLASQSAGTL